VPKGYADAVRWLALDVGARRVGFAVCDAEERVVTALPPLPFHAPTELASTVELLVQERGIGGVVVGVPMTRSGVGRGELRVAAVVAVLRARLAVPVETVDESGTSLEARERLREAGVPWRRWSGLIDGIAAQLILESFLAHPLRQPPLSAVICR
jgi:putative Holliday junction resolvase